MAGLEAARLHVKIGADTRQAERGIDSVSHRLQALGAKAGMVGTALSLGVTAPLAAIGKGALDAAIDYERGMNLLQAVTGASAEEMGALATRAKELGADLTLPATSASDAAEAMLELAKSGLSVNDILAASKGVLQLSAAGNLSNAQAAEIASNALNAFQLSGDKATMMADLLAAAANASSIEVKDAADSFKMAAAVFSAFQGPAVGAENAVVDLTTAIGVLGNMGIKGSDAGTSLKQMLLQLTGPSSKAKGQMIALAQSIGETGDIAYTADGRMRSLREIVSLTARATANMSDEQRNLALTEIFGADATRAIVALMRSMSEEARANGSDFDTLRQKVTQQGAAADLAGARMKGLGGALEALKSQLETTFLNLAEPLLEPLTQIVQAVAGVVSKVGELPRPLQDAGIAFGVVVAAAGPLALTFAGITTAAGFLLTPLGSVTLAVGVLAAAFGADVFGLRSGLLAFLSKLGEQLGSVGSQLAVFQEQGKLLEGFALIIRTTIGDDAARIFESFTSIIADAANRADIAIKMLGIAFQKLASGDFLGALDVAGRAVEFLVSGIVKRIQSSDIGGQIQSALGAAWTGIDWAAVWAAATNIAAGLAERFTGLVQTVQTSLQEQWAQIDWAAVWSQAAGFAAGLGSALDQVDWAEVGAKLGTALGMALSLALDTADKAGELSKKLADLALQTVQKVDWFEVGKKSVGLIAGFALGLFDLDTWGPILEKHWQEILLFIVTTLFTPAKVLKPIEAALSKIPLAGKVIEWVLSHINSMGAPLRAGLETFARDFGSAFAAAFGKAFGGDGASLLPRLRGFIIGALDGLKDLGETFYLRALEFAASLGRGLAEHGPKQVVDGVRTAVRALDSIAGWVIDQAKSIGTSIVHGVAAGVTAAGPTANNAVTRMARAALDAARAALDIHSPSEEFADLGELSAEGFAVGIDRGRLRGVAAVNVFMQELVANTTNYRDAFGKAAGSLASQLDVALTQRTEGALRQLARKLDKFVDDLRTAGVSDWRAWGDELAAAVLASLEHGSEAAVAAVHELIGEASELLTAMKSPGAILDRLLGSRQSLAEARETFGKEGAEAWSAYMTALTTGAERDLSKMLDSTDKFIDALRTHNVPGWRELGEAIIQAQTEGARAQTEEDRAFWTDEVQSLVRQGAEGIAAQIEASRPKVKTASERFWASVSEVAQESRFVELYGSIGAQAVSNLLNFISTGDQQIPAKIGNTLQRMVQEARQVGVKGMDNLFRELFEIANRIIEGDTGQETVDAFNSRVAQLFQAMESAKVRQAQQKFEADLRKTNQTIRDLFFDFGRDTTTTLRLELSPAAGGGIVNVFLDAMREAIAGNADAARAATGYAKTILDRITKGMSPAAALAMTNQFTSAVNDALRTGDLSGLREFLRKFERSISESMDRAATSVQKGAQQAMSGWDDYLKHVQFTADGMVRQISANGATQQFATAVIGGPAGFQVRPPAVVPPSTPPPNTTFVPQPVQVPQQRHGVAPGVEAAPVTVAELTLRNEGMIVGPGGEEALFNRFLTFVEKKGISLRATKGVNR